MEESPQGEPQSEDARRGMTTGVALWTMGWIFWAIHGALLLVGLTVLSTFLMVGVGGVVPGTALAAAIAYPGAVVSSGIATLLLGTGCLKMGTAASRPTEAGAPAVEARRPWGVAPFLFGFTTLSIAALFGMMGAGRIGPRDEIVAATVLVLLCWILSSLVFILAAVAMHGFLEALRAADPSIPAISGVMPIVYGIVNVIGVVLFAVMLLISMGRTVSPGLVAAAALLALLVVPVLAVISAFIMAVQGLRLRGVLTGLAPQHPT